MAHLANLNPAQLSAVTSETNILQVLAPPGSGKTKTLTSRVAHLLGERGIQPWNVICLTFTIKSAREMKERVGKLVGENIGNKVILGTFHSVCRRYLSHYGHLVGLKKGFGIADTSDTTGIVNRIAKKNKLSIEPKTIRSKISSCKAKNVGWEQLLRETTGKKKGVDQHEFITAYQQYEEHLQLSNLLDFDDLLLKCLDLLQQHPECVSNVQAVLIDEFQDTNFVQFDLMNLFAQNCKHITTVGDPDQSIYGWRSAEIKNLSKMQSMWPDTLVINLEQNYRSAGAILEVAQSLIEQDTFRPQKALQSTHRRGSLPVLRRLPNAAIEAEWIVSEIRRSISLTCELLAYADFVILLRSAALSRQIESALGNAGIPYRMVGGKKFFDRVEIKLLLDYLRVIAQPDNSDAVSRIINTPGRRIGPETIKALLAEATEQGTTVWQLLCKAAKGSRIQTKLSAPQNQGVSALYDVIFTCQKKLADAQDSSTPRHLLEHLVKKLKFGEYLEGKYKEDHELRWENVQQLFAQADDPMYYSTAVEQPDEALPQLETVQQEVPLGPSEALSRFLANVALSTDVQAKEENSVEGASENKVTISTIHAAKGLEWPVVFIPACYQGSIPHSRNEDVDEERRLLYVAMTRAKAALNMSIPGRSSTGDETTLSSFIDGRSIKNGLADQAPLLEYRIIADMASVLDRTCPDQSNLAAAVRDSGLKSIVDDLWPLDGQHAPSENDRLWSGQQDDQGFKTAFIGSKRRKISGEAAASAAQAEVRSTLYAKTTMNGASGFSIPGPAAGFVSAAQQMQVQAGIDAANKAHEEVSSGRPRKDDQAKPVKSKGAKRDASQLSLASWFGGAKSKCAGSEPASTAIATAPITSPQKTNFIGGPQKAPKPPAKVAFPPQSTSTNQSRSPMSTVPPAATNKLIRPASLAPIRKPLMDMAQGDCEARQRYVLLSSSPPPEREGDESIEARTTDSSSGAGQGSAVKSAAIMHTTTMSRLAGGTQRAIPGQTLGGPRRLGTRGPMAPWSARGRGGGTAGVRPSGYRTR